MASARWEAWAIARCISERDLVFEPIKGKHLYHTGSGNNYMLNPQCEEKKQVTETPFFIQGTWAQWSKLQETLFFVIKINYYYFWLV